MTNEDAVATESLIRGLDECFSLNRKLALSTVSHWIESRGSGVPDVPLLQEKIRSDALFWASGASQFELEAYLAASVMELERSPISVRAVKRLAALAWKNMGAEDRAKFKEWIERA